MNVNNIRDLTDQITSIRNLAFAQLEIITKIVDIAMADAVKFQSSQYQSECPNILSEDNLTNMAGVSLGLRNIYQNQDRCLELINAIKEPADAVLAEDSESPIEKLRARISQNLSAKINNLAVDEAQVITLPKGLPKISELHDGPTPPMNSLELLVSETSPLCDIFAPSPWFPEGRGTVTVGSKGFNYYKGTNPITEDSKRRSELPSGFYAGDGVPAYVLLRMDTCILLWDFKLALEGMQVYMVGFSDAVAEEAPVWFNPTAMSASLTARLMNELKIILERIKEQ